ncbi:MAG: HAMP domain-containing sensor histidine kinase [Thermaerobacter sp.]|nr:HAMP domain-containing sensor histidine kinase [Thermaerobacter sp.]
MKPSTSHTEARLLRRLQWRLALGFAIAFLVFDVIVVGLTYVVLDYHIIGEAKAAIEAVWEREPPESLIDGNETLGRPANSHPAAVRSDDVPPVVTWLFNKYGHHNTGPTSLYGLPVPVNAILPDQALLQQMPHSHQALWAVVKSRQYRVLVGSRPIWKGSTYLGAEQSVYSMGRLGQLMGGLIVVDLELSALAVALIIVLAFWLSGRALVPIRQALRRQRDFIQDVSHELRTPLTIIKSSLELALGESERSEVDNAVRNTLSEVDYVTRMMGDLAMLARIDSGATLVEPEVFDLVQLAQEVVQGLTPLASQRGVEVTFRREGDETNAVGDPVQIRQLLLILLDNALKYNHPGGTASLTVTMKPTVVGLTVENTGPGIPPEDLPYVFDRFYRSRSTNRLAPGSGLGLAIADWVVKAHKGHIRLSSEPGHGTRVMVEWPRHWERT